MAEYAERDILKQGDHYMRHITAMTAEKLHDKSDIAAELAHRDIEIKQLAQSCAFYQRRCNALQAVQSKMRDPERKVVCDILANGFTEVKCEEYEKAVDAEASSLQAEVDSLRDALDHIARVALGSIRASRRTLWIIERAKSALNRDDLWKQVRTPNGYHNALERR